MPYDALTEYKKIEAQKIRNEFIKAIVLNLYIKEVKDILECFYYLWQMFTPFIGLYNKKMYGHYYILHESWPNEVAWNRFPINGKPFIGLNIQVAVPPKITFILE